MLCKFTADKNSFCSRYMNQKDASLKSAIKPNSGFGIVAKSTFLMLLVFLLLASSTSIFSKNYTLNAFNNKGSSPLTESAFGKQIAQIPIFFAVLDPFEFENLSEDGIDEDSHDTTPDAFSYEDIACASQFAHEKRFSFYSSTYRNRQSVPFFILYHSWKSYLS